VVIATVVDPATVAETLVAVMAIAVVQAAVTEELVAAMAIAVVQAAVTEESVAVMATEVDPAAAVVTSVAVMATEVDPAAAVVTSVAVMAIAVVQAAVTEESVAAMATVVAGAPGQIAEPVLPLVRIFEVMELANVSFVEVAAFISGTTDELPLGVSMAGFEWITEVTARDLIIEAGEFITDRTSRTTMDREFGNGFTNAEVKVFRATTIRTVADLTSTTSIDPV
jgi:hypothetical protein